MPRVAQFHLPVLYPYPWGLATGLYLSAYSPGWWGQWCCWRLVCCCFYAKSHIWGLFFLQRLHRLVQYLLVSVRFSLVTFFIHWPHRQFGAGKAQSKPSGWFWLSQRRTCSPWLSKCYSLRYLYRLLAVLCMQ